MLRPMYPDRYSVAEFTYLTKRISSSSLQCPHADPQWLLQPHRIITTRSGSAEKFTKVRLLLQRRLLEFGTLPSAPDRLRHANHKSHSEKQTSGLPVVERVTGGLPVCGASHWRTPSLWSESLADSQFVQRVTGGLPVCAASHWQIPRSGASHWRTPRSGASHWRIPSFEASHWRIPRSGASHKHADHNF